MSDYPTPLKDAITRLVNETAGQGNIIAVNRFYVNLTGSLEAALLLAQIIYWSDRAKESGGWIAKSYAEWYEEIALSEYQVRTAMKALKPLGVETTTETQKKKTLPSPQNGDGQTPSKAKTEKPDPPQTTVVHFKDVREHYDSLTQEWDDDRYVYIGRANNRYGLPQSKWHNPFIMRDGDDERARVIHEYEVFIKAPRQIKLYNAIPELKSKTLVDGEPGDGHGDVLAKLADDPKFKPKDAWYEAVFETFKYTGGRNMDVQKMLRGEATKKGYAEYNLDPPLRTPDELLKWRDWWLAEHDDLSILEARDKVQSSIGTWRNDLLNKAVAPKADQTVYHRAKAEEPKPTAITLEIEKMIAETKAKLKGDTHEQ
jgi:hypothetical protein